MRSPAFAVFALVLLAACGSVKETPMDAPIDSAELAPPTAVTAIANVDLGARVTWTAPASGAPTGYTVTSTPSGGTIRVAGTSAVVSALTIAGNYTFTVTATYAAGDGPPSAPSNAVTIVSGPEAPTAFVACGADTQARLNAVSTTPPMSYNIYFGPDPMPSKLSTNKVNTPSLPYEHTGLTNGVELHYVITAVDASGIESADSMIDDATPDTVTRDTLFASSYNGMNQSIEIIDCLRKYPDASTAYARKIDGANAGIITSNYNQLAINPTNAVLYYRNPNAILVWADATRAAGNLAPTRTITSAALTNGRGIAIDPSRNLLYVANTNSILVFANALTANGTVAPVRTISATALTSASSLAIDIANDRLYVGNIANVLVIANASISSGTVTPVRTISINGVTLTSYGVALDPANDLLYLSTRNAGNVYSVPASTADGAVTPTRTIGGINTPMGIALHGNRLFGFSDNGSNRIMMWANANTVTGAVAPALVLFPSLTAASGFAYAPL